MIAWFKNRYFNPDEPLEHHIFMIFFFECFLLSLVSGLIEGSVALYGVVGTIVEWGFILACIFLLVVSPRIRITMQKPMLLLISFVYVPFLYLQSAGHDGTMLMFALLAVFMLTFVFKGRQMLLVIGLNMALYMALVWLGYQNPEWIIPYTNEEARIFDILTTIPMCFIALATMVVYVRRAYDNSNQSLFFLATKDELTGAYNRRSLTTFLEQRLAAKRSSDFGFIVMMLDIDFFKNVNDTYGHTYGDIVLRKFAATAQRVLRGQDILARYGGEEFVAVLDAMPPAQAIEIGERIRQAVKAMEFDNQMKVTVSIGLTRSQPGDTIEQLLNRADENLYKAKQGGRDRVVHDLSIEDAR